MGKLGYLALGLTVGFVLNGCATTAAFNYNYYGLAATSYDGTLQGPAAAQDIPLSQCAPDATTKGKCIVMLSTEFYQLKSDFENLEAQLNTCQKGTGQ